MWLCFFKKKLNMASFSYIFSVQSVDVILKANLYSTQLPPKKIEFLNVMRVTFKFL